MVSSKAVCFIVGSYRSGTTFLAEVLGRHPRIAQFHEPYFVWDRYFGPGEDDARIEAQATPRVQRYVTAEFNRFLRKSGAAVLVEKTPINSYRIPFINRMFPEARWIHLLRDGRDATLSMRHAWERRREVVESGDPRRMARLACSMLRRYPFWRNRFQALRFELTNNLSLRPRRYMNKAQWKGRAAWGARFPGWEKTIDKVSVLEFNALQWRHTVEAAREGLASIPSDRQVEVRYEDFTRDCETELRRIFDLIGLDPVPGLAADVSGQSVGRWHAGFAAAEKALVGEIIGDYLIALGYELDDAWYRRPSPGA
ncbi:MAG TPA: sulfotransferase [Alphaproteobacteria bacterium]|jgi:hypothetical protein|nr:sulfotransferase [Alphaproteobacteria bacterium]HJM50606.1 sulfotransferase [Alphaproteobacteria bacterium]